MILLSPDDEDTKDYNSKDGDNCDKKDVWGRRLGTLCTNIYMSWVQVVCLFLSCLQHSIGCLFDEWLIGWLISWTIGWLVVCLSVCLFGWLFVGYWLDGCLVGRLV